MVIHQNQSTSQQAPTGDPLRRLIVLGLMIGILSFAAALRFAGWDWDEGYLLHPDDRFVSWVTADIYFNQVLGVETNQGIASLADYFNTPESTLNPNNTGHGFYVYGDLPIIFTRIIAEQVEKTSLYTIYEVGRKLAAASDLLAIVFLFLAARRLFDDRIGVIAAGLYAFAGFPIQQSHFYTSDTFTNLFAMAAFWFAARAFHRHSWLDYPLFGLMLGCAMSSKISIAPLALILIAALALRVNREVRQTEPDLSEAWLRSPRGHIVWRAGLGLMVAGLVTIAVFRVAMPFAFLPPGSQVPIEAETLGTVMATISRLLDPLGFRPNPEWLRQMKDVRFQVSGYADIPPNHQWAKRLPLVFPWLNIVRVGLGWPLGIFAWLSVAWALWEIARLHRGAARLVLPVLWTLLFFVWQGSGWVMTMRYFLPIYGTLLVVAAWAIITLWDRVSALLASRTARRWHPVRLSVLALTGGVALTGLLWGVAVFQIYTRPHTRVEASHWMVQNIPSDVTLVFDTETGPREYQVGLWNDWPSLGQQEEDPTQPQVQYSYVDAGITRSTDFQLPFDGTLTAIRLNHVVDPLDLDGEQHLDVILTANDNFAAPLVSQTITGNFEPLPDDPRGDAYLIRVSSLPLTEGQTYKLTLQPGPEGPLVFSGSSLALESTWDDAIPLSVEGRNIWSMMYQGYTLQVDWGDTPDKRLRMQYILDNSDYVVISSNRFYATLNRNPQRWPMTIAYYQALFDGSLGFELVGDFTSRPSLGPISFHDDTAEEAWTVYDHPRVFVFQKSPNYDSVQTAAILDAANLDAVVTAVAPDAKGHPAKLPLPHTRGRSLPASRINSSGVVTRYDPQHLDIWSRVQPLTVVVWWLLIAAIGWTVFPLLWRFFPGLPDRGYGISRIVGLLLIAWSAWLLASIGSATWSARTILLMLLILALVSMAAIWRQRQVWRAWLRANRAHLWLVESGLLFLFLTFVLIRLGNPDLWHPAFGGEKPMDLAYFNAVLRSTSFPPYDPWFAGGSINYYYFGFVLVGVPVKLLGIPSTLAYNLILPTLYALTGGAAFSAAFNLVARTPGRDESTGGDVEDLPPLSTTLRGSSLPAILAALRARLLQTRLSAQPPAYIAGLAALLLAVVLGNLDQIRTVIWGLAELGHGAPQWTSTYLPPLGQVIRGLGISLRNGQPLPIGLGEWYWNATRLIPVPIDANDVPTEVGPITEFPFFTFLYADLHAHMISMPLTLAVVGWAVGLLKNALHFTLEDARSTVQRAGSLAFNGLLGAVIIGALRPTNTWDYPTYLALGAGAVVLATFIRRGDRSALRALGIGGALAIPLFASIYGFSLSSGGDGWLPLAGLAGGIGLLFGYGLGLRLFGPDDGERTTTAFHCWGSLFAGLVLASVLAGLTVLLYLPFIQNYQLGYDKVILWEGSKTPVWAYLDIHGLFLLLLVSWLLEEIGRALRPHISRRHALPLLLALGVAIAVSVLAANAISPVAGIAVPLLLAAFALFMRRDTTPEKQFALILIIGAFSLTLVVEVLVLQGDLSRMNTVFKFYLQVWLLLAVAVGAAFGWLYPRLEAARPVGRTLWAAIAAILVFLAALYPLMATRAKTADRWNPAAPHTLDGMAYMPFINYGENGATFSLAGDYDALRWLQDNVEGHPVVLEGLSWREYLWGSRVSVYTGLQSVIGWNWHQRQQRPPQAPEVATRYNDVAGIYNTTDLTVARDLLSQYGVDLIVVGALEQAYYDPAGLEKFDQMVSTGTLQLLYDRKGTRIYQVAEPALAGGTP